MREFVVITSLHDDKIDSIIDRTFKQHGKRVPLQILEEKLLEEVKYQPFVIYNQRDPLLKVQRENGFRVYRFKDGVVYR